MAGAGSQRPGHPAGAFRQAPATCWARRLGRRCGGKRGLETGCGSSGAPGVPTGVRDTEPRVPFTGAAVGVPALGGAGGGKRGARGCQLVRAGSHGLPPLSTLHKLPPKPGLCSAVGVAQLPLSPSLACVPSAGVLAAPAGRGSRAPGSLGAVLAAGQRWFLAVFLSAARPHHAGAAARGDPAGSPRLTGPGGHRSSGLHLAPGLAGGKWTESGLRLGPAFLFLEQAPSPARPTAPGTPGPLPFPPWKAPLLRPGGGDRSSCQPPGPNPQSGQGKMQQPPAHLGRGRLPRPTPARPHLSGAGPWERQVLEAAGVGEVGPWEPERRASAAR